MSTGLLITWFIVALLITAFGAYRWVKSRKHDKQAKIDHEARLHQTRKG